MTQTSELEFHILEAVRIYPEMTAYDYARLISMPNTDVVLRILESLAEKGEVRNVDEHDSENLTIRSVWKAR